MTRGEDSRVQIRFAVIDVKEFLLANLVDENVQ